MLAELDTNDWEEVFGEGTGGNTKKAVDPVRDCPADPPPCREEVVEILGLREGEHDGDHWLGVFRLRDGRYLYADAWCDYTGWD